MNIPLFSIIIPIYNSEKYLTECINSVLNQSFGDYEIILVNDGSSDKSGEMCDRYAKTDSRIRVMHKKNGGATSARKVGALEAKGKYVITLDSDDWMSENMLLQLETIILKYQPDVIAFGFSSVWSDKRKSWLPHFDEGFYEQGDIEYVKNNTLYKSDECFFTYGLATGTWTQCVKQELFLENQSCVDERIILGEDLCVTVINVLKAKTLYVLKKPLIMYRQVETSVSRRFRRNDILDLKNLLNYLESVILNDTNNLSEQLCAYSLHRLNCTVSFFAKNAPNFKTYKDMLSDIDKDLVQRLRNVDSNKLKLKTKLVLYLMRFKVWRFFWLVYKR